MNQKAQPGKKRIRQKSKTAWGLRITIFFAAFLLTAFLVVFGKDTSLDSEEFTIGEPAPRTLFSPYDLTYTDEEATEALRREASRKIPPVFDFASPVAESVRPQVDPILSIIHDYRIRKKENPDLTPDTLSLPLNVSPETRLFLIESADLEEIRKLFGVLFESLNGIYVFSEEEKAALAQKDIREIVVLTPAGEKTIPVSGIKTLDETQRFASEVLKGYSSKSRREADAVTTIFNSLLLPNLARNEIQTKERRAKAAQLVEPIKLQIKKNELVVQRGLLVNALHKTRIGQIQKWEVKQKVLDQFLSIGILIFLIYTLGFIYFLIFQKRILLSFRSTVLVHTIFLLTLLICKGISFWGGSTSHYLMPAAAAPVLLALLVNAEIAFLSAGVMAVIVGALAGFSPAVMIAALLSSMAGVLASLRLRKRMDFLKVGLAVGATNFLVIVAFQILKEHSFQEYIYVAGQGFASGLLVTTPIVFLLIPLFESFFGLVTDITLLELSDLNHPLLKRMVVEAPGTYHHSLVVATLAESACEAIGANALLARVGCYFHDIGKIARAEYFTENEPSESKIRHEKITPTMSCLIILNHVKDGIELGKKYKLRQPILRFIPEHQGTGVIYYFYKKAVDQAEPGHRVDPNDFRYPGPKPQSRETAVALLADSTEAASRSLKNPTPEAIRQLVRKIINDKFIDGQLDECNLSLRDLHQIQEKFVQNLMAIYHTRVTYPEKPESADKPDLFRVDDFSKYRIKP